MLEEPEHRSGELFSSLGANAMIVRMATALKASPFGPRKRWPACVVVLRPEGDSVTSRSSHAGWLRANDLPALARECLARQSAPGQILIYVEADRENASGVFFLSVDMLRERARLSV